MTNDTLPREFAVNATLVEAGLLFWIVDILLAQAGIALRRWERVLRWMIWVMVAFSAVSLLLNLITPSAGERMLWAPAVLVLLVCSLLVATGRRE